MLKWIYIVFWTLYSGSVIQLPSTHTDQYGRKFHDVVPRIKWEYVDSVWMQRRFTNLDSAKKFIVDSKKMYYDMTTHNNIGYFRLDSMQIKDE